MIAFRDRPLHVAMTRSSVMAVGAVLLFASTAVVVSVTSAALAQDGPRRLMPVQRAPAATEPPAAQPGLTAPRPSTRALGRSGVQVDTLARIDPDSVGTLSASDGGLGHVMWRGTPRSVAEALIDALPDMPNSPVLYDLMRRLLLSRAAVPEGEAAGELLVVRRARKLAAMGDIDALMALIEATQGRERPQQLARLEAEVRLARYELPLACKLAGTEIERDDDPYWNKLFVFCQALAGDTKKATLGLALLREMMAPDATYEILLDAVLNGAPAKLDGLPRPNLLHVAMARVTKTDIPPDALEGAGPAELAAIAAAKRLPLELRIDAAERAVASGAISADIVDRLYGQLKFTDAELANPLKTAEGAADSMRSRALLYLTAFKARIPVLRAEVIAQALDVGRQADRYEATARTFGPVLTAVTPSQELIWFAPRAVRAHLVAGGADAARRWYTLLRRSATRQAEALTAVSRLAPSVAVAIGEDDGAGPDSLVRWWLEARSDPAASGAATYLAAIYMALGLPVPKDFLESLPAQASTGGTAPMPPTALWFRLLNLIDDLRHDRDRSGASASAGMAHQPFKIADAGARDAGVVSIRDSIGVTVAAPVAMADDVKGHRRAEAVALVLMVFSNHGPGGVHPAALHNALLALRAVGLDGAARAVALEAVLGHGL